MTRIIATALCIDPAYTTSVNLKGKQADSHVRDMYLAYSFVSLFSAKQFNPDDETCLVSNFDLPESWRSLFLSHGIKQVTVPWTSFVMPTQQKWALAYYKLNALSYLAENYNTIMLMDCDTITINDYEDLWKDANEWLLLYRLDYSRSHPERRQISANFATIFQGSYSIDHIGGEFIAGSASAIKSFLKECTSAFSTIANNLDKYVDCGDEQVLSVAAERYHGKVLSANRYILRFWTGYRYRLVSSRFHSDRVSILHLPGEKKYSLPTLSYFMRAFSRMPSDRLLFWLTGVKEILPNLPLFVTRIAVNRLYLALFQLAAKIKGH